MEQLVYFLPIVIGVIILAKLVLFVLFKSRRDKFLFVIYYPAAIIILTENPKKRHIKQLQNYQSQVVALLVAVYIVFHFIIPPE